jgi:hypothetical protein
MRAMPSGRASLRMGNTAEKVSIWKISSTILIALLVAVVLVLYF